MRFIMILIKNGRVFDGSKNPSFIGSVLVDDGKVKQIIKNNEALPELPETAEVIDATGQWITPGFIDSHTHYDFEVLVNPSLNESVRHGITTVFAGSCSITAIMAEPEDCSDIFTRVEGVPRELVLPVLREKKTWNRPKQYVDYLNSIPLGANVCSYIGHSDIRMAAMGIENSVDEEREPTKAEMLFMKEALEEAMEAGYLGMSSMQSDADRLDGDRVRSKALPSVYASYKEYSYLNKVLRKHKGILQTAPDVRNPIETMMRLLVELIGVYRKRLRITSLVMMDSKSGRGKGLTKLQLLFSRAASFVFGKFKWQMLPCEFQAQVAGMNFVVFEEVPAGGAYLHLMKNADREKLIKEPEFRQQFKKNLTERFRPALWNRDIGDGRVFECPDKSLEGLTFREISQQRDVHVADLFVDLLIKYGDKLIWKLVVGNEVDKTLESFLRDDAGTNIVSFSDAGAHLQNIAFYNFHLQMLGRIKRMRENGLKTISDEHAIHRITGEVADWHKIDAGYLKQGKRADITVLDPTHIEKSIDSVDRADFDGIDGFSRLVNRNDGIIKHVLINGKLAVSNDEYNPDLGKSMEYGSFLKGL